jgi:2-C-methyl-D-erythritol 4-phosphate cytidylyltransferase
LKAFSEAPEIENIVLVADSTGAELTDIVNDTCGDRWIDIVKGGVERYHSVYCGLQAESALASDFVFIHDAARPFVDGEIIGRAAAAVQRHPAIVVGLPVRDTIKLTDIDDMVCETPDRARLWAVQTPQVFATPLIRRAYEQLIESESAGKLPKKNITDDAMVLELFSETKVQLIEGSERNIKITTPLDMIIAEAIWNGGN